jgi:hypothetical protein
MSAVGKNLQGVVTNYVGYDDGKQTGLGASHWQGVCFLRIVKEDYCLRLPLVIIALVVYARANIKDVHGLWV